MFRNGCYAFLIQKDDPPTKQGDRVWREMAQRLIFENSEDPNTYLLRNSSCPRILQKFIYVADCFPTLNNRNVNNTKTSTKSLVMSNSLPIQKKIQLKNLLIEFQWLLLDQLQAMPLSLKIKLLKLINFLKQLRKQ